MKPVYKCDYCFDRGVYFAFRNGNRVSLGEKHEMECPHCKGNWIYETNRINQRLKNALLWFRISEPPASPFRISKWRFIDDPKKLWAHLKQEIALDNIYALERLEDDLVMLQGMFGGSEL